MNFGDAILALKDGKKVARATWDHTNTWLFLVPQGSTLATPTAKAQILAQFIAMKTANGPIVPWVASHYDMLAENWETIA